MFSGTNSSSEARPVLLASVTDLEEAEAAMQAGATMIDLKAPSLDVLGAVSREIASEVAFRFSNQVFISAAAGLLGDQGEILKAQILAETGVDAVKVGVPPGREMLLEALSMNLPLSCHLVIVFSATHPPEAGRLRSLREQGVWGAMLDTWDKNGQGLRESMSPRSIAKFVEQCREVELRIGLAGSLGIDDIVPLSLLEPDYLGFRGALCVDGVRSGRLDPERVRRLCGHLENYHERTAIPGGVKPHDTLA